MAFSKITKDMNIIAALDDEPNDVGGLSAAQLKAKFDEGGLALKTFINNLIDAIAAGTAAANIGAKNANDETDTLQNVLDDLIGAVIGTLPDGSVTTAKLHDGAVTTAKLDDPASTNIGVIIRSVRTDLGDRWALCNGDAYDPTEYPELAALVGTNSFPKKRPALGSSNAYGTLYQLRNGEFLVYTGQNAFDIVGTDGAVKYTYSGNTLGYGSPWLVDHNGNKYVIITVTSGASYSGDKATVYTTTDFSSFTKEKEITMPYCSNCDDCYGWYDGTYFYLSCRDRWSAATAQYCYVLDNSYTQVGSRADSSSGYRIVVPCGGSCYEVRVSNNDLSVGILNGAFLGYSGFFTVSSYDGSQNYARMFPLNDDFNVLWGGGTKIVFVPTDPSGTPKTKAFAGQAILAFVNGNTLYVYYYYNSTVYCATMPTNTADPSQASAWTVNEALYANAYTEITDTNGLHTSYCHWRHSTGTLVGGKDILRAYLLPTKAEAECYTYIKVKE